MVFARNRAVHGRCLHAALIGLACVCASPVLPADPPAVFVADHQRLHAIDPQTNGITQSTGLTAEPEALAPALNGGVWVLANKRLLRYSAALAYELEFDIRRAGAAVEGAKRLVANPYDGSLWVSGEKTVAHLDAEGRVLGSWKAGDEIKAIALDPDETLWVLAKKGLWRLSTAVSLLQTLDPAAWIKEPEHLAVDRLGNRLWLSNGRELVAVSTETMQSLARLDLRTLAGGSEPDDDGHKARALAIHPIFGTVWVATKTALLLFDRNGVFLKHADLRPYDLSEIEAMAFDAANFALWIGGKKAVARFQSNGEFVARIPIASELEAIAVAGFKLLPTLTLLMPPDGLVTNNAFTPLRYRLGADCTGTPCVLDPDYARSFKLEADWNGVPIGPLFNFLSDEATFTPSTRWAEGLNSLSAQALDRYGHKSERLASRFIVDTIPPRFLTLTPTDGSVFTSGAIAIQGSLDDPTGGVSLLDGNGAIVSTGGAQFAFSVILKQGWNTFELTARDPAGNETRAPLRVYLNPLDATLTGLASGAIVDTDRLSLNGTYLGPENTGITVNGVVAMTDGNQFYVNNLPLQPGQNTLTIVVTSPDGQTITRTVTVTSSGSTPLRVAVEPPSGVAPLRTRFRVNLLNGAAPQGIALDIDGDGYAELSGIGPDVPIEYVFESPGVYRPRVIVTDSGGNTWSQTLTVIAQDPAVVDDFFGRLWSGMNGALAGGNITSALTYMNEPAQQKYRAVLESLLPRMPEIIGSYSPPARLSASESIGEYAVSRPYQGRTRVYLINFLRDASGVWRLDSM